MPQSVTTDVAEFEAVLADATNADTAEARGVLLAHALDIRQCLCIESLIDEILPSLDVQITHGTLHFSMGRPADSMASSPTISC